MKTIPLTHGLSAIVDDEWYDYLMQWKWHARKSSNDNYYAARTLANGQKVFMHRVVAKTPDGMFCDHINHNTLDNRASQLRNVNASQSVMNRKKPKNNKTGALGVTIKNGKYRAVLIVNRKMVLDRLFDNIQDAKEARKQAEKKYFGEFSPPES